MADRGLLRNGLWRLLGLAVVGFVALAACGIEIPGDTRSWTIGSVALAGPPPDDVAVALVVGTLALALAAAMYRPLWLVVRYIDTLVHELGHAMWAAVVGARPGAISIHLDSSGLAHSWWSGQPGRVRRSVVALAGYLAPPIVGFSAVQAYRTGYGALWLTVAAAITAFALAVLLRNVMAVVVAIVVLGVAVVILTQAPSTAGEASVLVGTVLAVTGIRSALNHLRLARTDGSDAATVHTALRIPARFVAFMQVAAATVLGVMTISRAAGIW